MSVKINPKNLIIWYQESDDSELYLCEKDIIIFNYQRGTLTVRCDFEGRQVGTIVTDKLEKFIIEYP